jgi:HSP20 family molecular chaperone IbpA
MQGVTRWTVTTSWDLFEDLLAAQDEVMRTGWGWARRHGRPYDADAGAVAWAPAIEISGRKDAYLVSAELPGISAGEVEITMADGLLTIQGERHAAREAAGEKIHRSERGYGVFRRSLALPSSRVEADKTEASAGEEGDDRRSSEARQVPMRLDAQLTSKTP